MKQLTEHLRSIVVLTLVVALAGVTIPQPRPLQAAGSAPVTVTNTPLPVQGTVSATQSGPWNVGISGTPSVSVSSLPAVQFNGAQPVTVTNTPLSASISGSPTITLPTHLGIQPSSMVALTCVNVQPFVCAEFAQVAPDGSVTNPFSIPAGMDLVITEASWSAIGGISGKTARFSILASSGASYHHSMAQINADGIAGANEIYTSGFRVSTMPTFVVSPGMGNLVVRGYLVSHQ